MKTFILLAKQFFVVVSLLLVASPVYGIEKPEKAAVKSAVFTELGKQVDTSVVLTDSNGRGFSIKELLADGKPLIIVPVYYTCPRLCGLVLNGVSNLIRELPFKIGEDYKVLSASFDIKDDAGSATIRAKRYREAAGLPPLPDSMSNDWVFGYGDSKNVPKLMEQIGFNYLEDGGDFSHSAAFMLLTPDGIISQFFTGIDYSPWDVRLALVEASEGKIGSPLEQIFLFCFRFDPTKGKYTWAAWNVARLGSALSLLLFFGIAYRYIKKGSSDTD